jgi:inosose dehydratase
VIDWRKVLDILRTAGWNGVLSVECGTSEQAERSLVYLSRWIGHADKAAV